jgi:dipeptidyl-peptidase-3
MGSSFEECRAECVGVYLCTHSDVLRIFGYEGQAAEDIYYINWLNMVRAGAFLPLRSLVLFLFSWRFWWLTT